MELYSVIKNDGPGSVLFWKFQGEDFKTGSRLIVNPGEEAVFVKNGTVHAVFENGDYQLETNNYPFITALRSAFSGGVSAFNCLIYFVRTADNLHLVWGTATPLQVRDPVWDISLRVRARGAYTVKIADASKFLFKFVGNNVQMISPEMFKEKFKAPFIQKLTTAVTRSLQEAAEEILVVKNNLDTFADSLKPSLDPLLEEYGVTLVNFYIEALDIDDKDPGYAQLQEIRNTRNRKRVGARGDVDELTILGRDWERIQQRNILLGAATNEGAAGAGAGIGVGMGAGGAMGVMASTLFSHPMQQPAQPASPCPGCRAPLAAGAKFCAECGAPAEAPRAAVCPHCARAVAPGAKFCAECGSKLS